MSDRDTLAEPIPVGYVHVERTGPGWRLVEDEGMAPDASLIAAGWANEAVGVVYLHREVKGWRPPAREITTAAEADALPVGSIVRDAFAAACTRVHPDPVVGWVRATRAVRGGHHCHPPYLPATVLYIPTEES